SGRDAAGGELRAMPRSGSPARAGTLGQVDLQRGALSGARERGDVRRMPPHARSGAAAVATQTIVAPRTRGSVVGAFRSGGLDGERVFPIERPPFLCHLARSARQRETSRWLLH